jgi:hypothetical protein
MWEVVPIYLFLFLISWQLGEVIRLMEKKK